MEPKHWPEVCRAALIHCYTSETAPLAVALKELERATRPEPYRCPYCLMRQPKTWDHFLAKEDFPEFSTLASNLIRACDPCNRKKLRNFTNAPRRVVNPYFDPIPDLPLLRCNVSIDQEGRLSLLYHIFRLPGAPDSVLDLFERHFDAFQLQSDLTIEGATTIDTFMQEILYFRNEPFAAEELEYQLCRKLNGLNKYPANSWEVATFEGLRECADFLAYVNARVGAIVERPPRIDRTALRAALREAEAR